MPIIIDAAYPRGCSTAKNISHIVSITQTDLLKVWGLTATVEVRNNWTNFADIYDADGQKDTPCHVNRY